MSESPFVSIVIPCRDEHKHIRHALESIVAQDYDLERLEVLIVDGMSEDGTREIVKDFAARYPFVHLLDNPKKITPAALNIGIKAARGEIIVRMDAHSSYVHTYVSQSVVALQERRGDVVGGVCKTVPEENTFIGRAIALSVSSRFGVGNAHYRTGRATEEVVVDGVPFGSYHKDLFERIGLFDEELPRSEDVDLYRRVAKSGGKVLLIPSIVIYYRVQSNPIGFLKHMAHNGFLVTFFLSLGKVAFFPRHLAPLAAMLTVVVTAFLAWLNIVFLWLLVLMIGTYALTNFTASLRIAIANKDLRYFPAVSMMFALVHLSYGLGSLYGLLQTIASGTTWRRLYARWKPARSGSH